MTSGDDPSQKTAASVASAVRAPIGPASSEVPVSIRAPRTETAPPADLPGERVHFPLPISPAPAQHAGRSPKATAQTRRCRRLSAIRPASARFDVDVVRYIERVHLELNELNKGVEQGQWTHDRPHREEACRATDERENRCRGRHGH